MAETPSEIAERFPDITNPNAFASLFQRGDDINSPLPKGFSNGNLTAEEINQTLATLTTKGSYASIYNSVFDSSQGNKQNVDLPSGFVPYNSDGSGSREPGNVDIHNLPNGDNQVVSDPSELKPGVVLVNQNVVDKTHGSNNVGATADGPWINADGTYDLSKKDKVDGDISWPSNYKLSMDDDSIRISGNALPSTTTGEFPIDPSSSAHQYDPNPNKIEPVNFDVTLPRNPVEADTPTAVGLGTIGVLKNGGLLYASIDGKGQDANKHETQDDNDGHPSETDYYHTHQVPPVLYENQSKTGPSPVLGRALDGYPIVAAYNEHGDLYSTSELDKYHGTTVKVTEEDGSVKDEWAYCVSLDWPYTIGAFKGTPAKVNGLQAPGPSGGPPDGPPDAPPDGPPKSAGT